MVGQGKAFPFYLLNDPVAQRMKGQRIHSCARALLDTAGHLSSRVFAKGHQQDLFRLPDTSLDKVSGFGNDHTCLSRPRSCQDQCCVFVSDHSQTLFGRERVRLDGVEERLHLGELRCNEAIYCSLSPKVELFPESTDSI